VFWANFSTISLTCFGFSFPNINIVASSFSPKLLVVLLINENIPFGLKTSKSPEKGCLFEAYFSPVLNPE
jgi:hypothetical protein